MSHDAFKVPSRKQKTKHTHKEGDYAYHTCKVHRPVSHTEGHIPNLPLCMPLAMLNLSHSHDVKVPVPEKRITRGSIRAWQEGYHKPWSELPDLRLKILEKCATSDYGTASESSYNCSSVGGVSPVCTCEDADSLPASPSENDTHIAEPAAEALSNCKWYSSDSESDDGFSMWDDPPHRVYMLRDRLNKLSAVIPIHNRKRLCDLRIRVLNDDKYKPQCSIRMHQVSPVVSMEPHGTQFNSNYPIYLSVPISTLEERHLVCLYSNTQEDELPKWERLPKTDYKFRDGFAIIIVSHFSLFTVVHEEPYPEHLKRIRRRMGGTLRIEEVPGVEVMFPKGCLDDDVDAYLRVLYDCEPTFFGSHLLSSYALASPIIMIGPHGHQFDPGRPAVVVTLPIPDMQKICQKFHIQLDQVVSTLSVWQSRTMEYEPVVWERLDTKLTVNMNHPSGIPVVSFEVRHFSFFTIIWDLLSTSLYEAKMGMAYYYPYITFSMMCEAFMQETPNTNRFALEVICHRSDRRLPEMPNLQHRVGSSIKPKMMRPGRILVRLKSQMFEADEDAGEDKEMAKEEPDFRGRDFEKQYACRFKNDLKQDLGAFGKVLVENVKATGRNDPVFEFNLYKTGHETESHLPEKSERWTIVAIKELAANLQITDDNNWKKFAQHIGFTRSEIKSKLQLAADPFMAMMTLYNQRGGTPEEFVQALFAVNREIRMNLGKNTPPSSSSHGSLSPSHSGSSLQRTPSHAFFWPWRNQRQTQQNGSDTDMPAPEPIRKGMKRSHPSSGKNSSNKTNKARRKTFSDAPERLPSSSSGEADNSSEDDSPAQKALSQKSSDLYRNNPRKLTDHDIWRVSTHMASISWKALGRSLGIEESLLLNIEQSYKHSGVRECAYQMLLEWKGIKPRKCTLGMLYTALCNEKMNAVAKQVIQIKFGEDDS